MYKNQEKTQFSKMLRRYIIISFALHVMAIIPLGLLQDQKKPRGIPSPLIARLITAEPSSQPDRLPNVEKDAKEKKKDGIKYQRKPTTTKKPLLKKKRMDKSLQKLPRKKIAKLPEVEREKVMPEKGYREIPSAPRSKKTMPGAESNRYQRGIIDTDPLRDKNGTPLDNQSNLTSGSDKESQERERGRQPSMLAKLFDEEIIERHALLSRGKSGSIEKEAGEKESTDIIFQVGNLKYYGYMERLKEKIESIWIYPPHEAKRGIYGDLYIKFTIKKNGTLGAVKVVRTSGHRSLDVAALNALRDAAPFWPLPESWNTDSFTIDGHFVYSIYGTYLY